MAPFTPTVYRCTLFINKTTVDYLSRDAPVFHLPQEITAFPFRLFKLTWRKVVNAVCLDISATPLQARLDQTVAFAPAFVKTSFKTYKSKASLAEAHGLVSSAHEPPKRRFASLLVARHVSQLRSAWCLRSHKNIDCCLSIRISYCIKCIPKTNLNRPSKTTALAYLLNNTRSFHLPTGTPLGMGTATCHKTHPLCKRFQKQLLSLVWLEHKPFMIPGQNARVTYFWTMSIIKRLFGTKPVL